MGKVHKNFITYWKNNIWDRDIEEKKPVLGDYFIGQRRLTIDAISSYALKKNNPIVVVDLCCGTGKITEELVMQPYIRKVIAIDINPKALNYVKNRVSNVVHKVEIVCSDAMNVNLKEIDVIICLDSIHHFYKPRAFFEVLYKSLKTGGLLVGNVMNKENRAKWLIRKYGIKALQGLIEELIDPIIPQESVIRDLLFYKFGMFRLRSFYIKELAILLDSVGFYDKKIIEGYYHWFKATK